MAFEESKIPDGLFIMGRVQVVLNRRDTPEDPSLASSDKEFRFAVIVEREPGSIEFAKDIAAERGHPMRIVPIDFPWEIDEPFGVGSRTNWRYLQGHDRVR